MTGELNLRGESTLKSVLLAIHHRKTPFPFRFTVVESKVSVSEGKRVVPEKGVLPLGMIRPYSLGGLEAAVAPRFSRENSASSQGGDSTTAQLMVLDHPDRPSVCHHNMLSITAHVT